MTNPPRISPALGRPNRPMGLPTGKRPVVNTEILAKDVIEQIHRVRAVPYGMKIDLTVPLPGISYFEWKHLSRADKFELYKEHLEKKEASNQLQDLIDSCPVQEKPKKFDPYKKCKEECCTIITSPFDTIHWPYCSYDCKDWAEQVERSKQ